MIKKGGSYLLSFYSDEKADNNRFSLFEYFIFFIIHKIKLNMYNLYNNF